MPDTMRSLSVAGILLADNTNGNISPQDLRDVLLATVQPGHGEISVTTPAATTLSDTSTWVQVAGTYALSDHAMHWEMAVNGQLRYTGAEERVCHIAASVSMNSAGTNDILEWVIAKDGVPILTSRIQRYVSIGTDVGSTALHAFTDITNGSYLCVMTRNITAAVNTTAETLNLFVMDMAA